MFKKRFLGILISSILVFSVFCLSVNVLASQDTAQTAIDAAKKSLEEGYVAAKDAAVNGVNVSYLLSILNSAGNLLTQAEAAYANSDFESAYNYAQQSQQVLGDVVAQAVTLKTDAIASGNQAYQSNVVVPLIISFVISGLGVSGWIWLRRKEHRRSI